MPLCCLEKLFSNQQNTAQTLENKWLLPLISNQMDHQHKQHVFRRSLLVTHHIKHRTRSMFISVNNSWKTTSCIFIRFRKASNDILWFHTKVSLCFDMIWHVFSWCSIISDDVHILISFKNESLRHHIIACRDQVLFTRSTSHKIVWRWTCLRWKAFTYMHLLDASLSHLLTEMKMLRNVTLRHHIIEMRCHYFISYHGNQMSACLLECRHTMFSRGRNLISVIQVIMRNNKQF